AWRGCRPDDSCETTASLEDKTAQIGITLLIESINRWTSEKITPQEQRHDQATYTRLLKKESGKIDWSKSDQEIEHMIRALNPWPGTWTEWNGKRVKVLHAHLDDGRLVIDELQPEGKKPMDARTFMNGYLEDAQRELPIASLFRSQADGLNTV
ncbi:MAG: hypothetical protein AAB855_02880, partial [Patescibacteria group bacterium]